MTRPTRILPAAFALMALGLMTGSVMASISGSKHDFADTTQYPTNWSGGEICKPCHAPHNTTPTSTSGGQLEGPLWNHALATNASYSMYISGQLAQGQSVDQNSILCLSCHDGTLALDSFGGATGSTKLASDNPANLGTDLSNDHPIGAAALWPNPTPSYMVDPSLRVGIMPLRQMADGTNAVGCTSCHEPHDRKNDGSATAPKHMLWVANDQPGTTVDGRTVDGSLLCMNCHKK